jgi:DNA-binding LytR/AlgR family response regulator
VRIAIVEDEQTAAQELKRCLNRYQNERHQELKITRFDNSITFLNDVCTSYDIVFMDIEMPYMNGMQAAAEMRKINTETCLIFVTNMAQYAIKGYEVDAMDFILKRDHPKFCVNLRNGVE